MAGTARSYWKAAQIPAKSATLDNGLRVLAHRDSQVPLVAVFVAYHAGSGREPRSKAGLAHLAEHLMFCGSKHAPESYFLAFEGAGASSINAHVREDYTAYFEAVPSEALDLALWMESERMAYLADVLDRGKFEAQREVVRNELIQRESEPYGAAPRVVACNSFSTAHPYSHPVNGLLEDLDNLSQEDAHRWLQTYHGAANATLIIAGDVEPARAIDKARRYFSDVPSGVVSGPLEVPLADRAEPKSLVVESRVPSPRLYRVWNVPHYASAESAVLELACETLAGGVASILWRRLVEEERLAAEVGTEFRPRALGSQALLWATVSRAKEGRAVEEVLEREVRRFLTDGPGDDDLDAARVRMLVRFLRGIERMCGPASRAEALAEAFVLAGAPGFHAERFRRLESATREQVIEVARRWFDRPALNLEFRPMREGGALEQ